MVQHFLLKCIPNWQKPTPPINYRIYAVNLSVAGMMGAGLMRDVPCFQGRMVQVFLITEVISTLGLVIQSITMTKLFLTNQDFPVFHLQGLHEVMGLIM
nr:MAG TPA: hypothetical protein [Caudoviricetes sp.]